MSLASNRQLWAETKNIMEQVTGRAGLYQQLRDDSFIRVYALLFVLTHIPFFLPGFSLERFYLYPWLVTAFFLLPCTIFTLWPSAKAPFLKDERRFWKTLSIAYSFWWLVSLINVLWPIELWNSTADIITDSIYLFYYMGWFVALSYSPHVNLEQRFLRSDRWLFGAGFAVLSFCLFAYFILVPSRMVTGGTDLWVPSLLFMAGLDLVLILLMNRFLYQKPGPRWATLYRIMIGIMLFYVFVDLLEALDYSDRFVLMDDAAMEVIWSIPFIGLVLLGRIRSYVFPRGEEQSDTQAQHSEQLSTHISPILMLAFVMPVMHILLVLAGHIKEETHLAQGVVVLGSLLLFWLLAALENRSLRRQAAINKAHDDELRQLREKQDLEQKAEQVQNQFLANISHEIRTPMNGILSMSEILLKARLEDKQQQQLELLHSSAQGLLAVIDDILAYSRLAVGEISIIKQPFDLRVTAEQVLQLARVAAGQKAIELTLDIREDVPTGLVGDETRLRQVLVNLVSNAVKFTDEGRVTLRFSLLDKTDSVARIRSEIIDSGIGIEPEFKADMFRAFTQADTSNSRKYGGSGLGLTIAKQIIEAQGGSIGVNRNADSGSTFWFDLAYGYSEESAPNPIVAEPAERDCGTSRILLVEDDLVNQEVLSQQLKYLNVTNIKVASNGLLALEALENSSFDLVLMDCQMPQLDGLEATRRIRALGYTQELLPIIALTAHAFAEDKARCLESGMNDFLSKPVKISKLQSVLAQWLRLDGKQSQHFLEP